MRYIIWNKTKDLFWNDVDKKWDLYEKASKYDLHELDYIFIQFIDDKKDVILVLLTR